MRIKHKKRISQVTVQKITIQKIKWGKDFEDRLAADTRKFTG